MPVISRFYGITIKMYFQNKEHNPPHLHAIYQDCAGSFLIENGQNDRRGYSCKRTKTHIGIHTMLSKRIVGDVGNTDFLSIGFD